MSAWGCRCGADANWATRSACRNCGAAAPRKVLDAIANAAKKPKPGAHPQAWGQWKYGAPSAHTQPHGKGDNRVRQLEAEIQRLKRAAADPNGGNAAAAVAPSGDDEDIRKLVDEIKQLKGVGKRVTGLSDIIEAKEAKVSELRAAQLRAKPGSVRLRQLESDAKRKSAELEALQKRKQATIERIEAERVVLAKMEADAAKLVQHVADLQASVAKLAEEIQAEAKPAAATSERHHTAAGDAAADTGDDDFFDEVMANEIATFLGVEGGSKRLQEAMRAATAAKRARKGV